MPNCFISAGQHDCALLTRLLGCRSSTFTMEAAYTDDSVLSADGDRHIASFTIGPPVAAKAAPGAAEAKLKVHFRLNLHGIVTVESVNQLEEEEYEEEVKIEKVSQGESSIDLIGLIGSMRGRSKLN